MNEQNQRGETATTATGPTSKVDGQGAAAGQPPAATFITTAEAARELSTNEHALREKIRRAARRVGGRQVADLDIIVFYKFGRSWRGRWAV